MYKLMDVSEERSVSIFRVEDKAMQQAKSHLSDIVLLHYDAEHGDNMHIRNVGKLLTIQSDVNTSNPTFKYYPLTNVQISGTSSV
jgi:hypothetical protein